jgi:hypothetical protein
MRQSRDSSSRRAGNRVKAEKQFAIERAKIEFFQLFFPALLAPLPLLSRARARNYFDDFPNQFDCEEPAVEWGGGKWSTK